MENIKILTKNVCELNCNCGWNITFGGWEKRDMEMLLKYAEEVDRILQVEKGQHKCDGKIADCSLCFNKRNKKNDKTKKM